jgi:hypothetical protein
MKRLHMWRMAASGGRLLTAAALALALGASEARADHVFMLSGVTFDDSTLATGKFTTNDALTSLLNWDITTVNGAIPGFHYTPGTSDSSSTSLPFIIVLNTPPDLDHILELTFASPLTAAGAAFTTSDPFGSFEESPNGGDHRVVMAGFAVPASTVPEPSALALVGTAALAGLRLWARRPRRT